MQKKRNCGIDMLKILCMFFIVIQHIVGHGGITQNNEFAFNINYEVAWLIKCFVLCAVDCYAMASGYLLYDSNIKLSRLFKLWVQIETYSVLCFVGTQVMSGNPIFSVAFIKSFFPILSKQYWYTTIYFGLFFLIPFYNHIIKSFTQKQMKKWLITFFIIICVIPSIINFDLFETPTGSLLWMSICYFVGAYIHKYNIRCDKALLLYSVGALVMWCSKFLIDIGTMMLVGGIGWGQWFISFTSPFCVISALGLFLYFVSKNDIFEKCNKQFENIANMTLAVYLIHDNFNFKQCFIKDKFTGLVDDNTIIMIFVIFGSSMIIFVFSVAVESIRRKLMHSFTDRIGYKLSKFDQYFMIEELK